jgi:hypothetical protein
MPYGQRGESRGSRLLNPGEIIKEKYEVLKTIGGGAYGTVYLVRDIVDHARQWALKEVVESDLPPQERDDARALFSRETEILKSLSHPGLPEVADAFSIEERHYLVMEYVEGETLDELLKKRGGPFSADEVLNWAYQLAAILEYLHTRTPHPVIFRDLKPSNIMLHRDGWIRLIDFGIARHFVPGKIRDTFLMGTPGFSPPEQYGSGQSDHRSDIFSFGATLYYLLTKADMDGFGMKFPPPSSLNKNVPGWLEKVIMKCLSINPGERYQATGDLVKDIEQRGFSGRGASAAAAPAGAPAATQARASMPTLPGCLILILAVLAATAHAYAMHPLIMAFVLLLFFFLLVKTKAAVSEKAHIFLISLSFYLVGIVLISGFARGRECGLFGGCKSALYDIHTAIELYNEDDGMAVTRRFYGPDFVPSGDLAAKIGHYPKSLASLVPRYLKNLPRCPKQRTMDYLYIHRTDPEIYTLICSGAVHERMVHAGFPQYDAVQGLYDH